MAIIRKITAITEKGTITGYVYMQNSGPEAFRLKPPAPGFSAEFATGTGDLVGGYWLKCQKNGQGAFGWVDVRRGLLTQSGEADPPPDPPPAGKTLTHTIEIFDDGSISIDGIPYP